MNVIAQLEFELAYYDPADQCFNHYVTTTLPPKWICLNLILIQLDRMQKWLTHTHTHTHIYIYMYIYTHECTCTHTRAHKKLTSKTTTTPNNKQTTNKNRFTWFSSRRSKPPLMQGTRTRVGWSRPTTSSTSVGRHPGFQLLRKSLVYYLAPLFLGECRRGQRIFGPVAHLRFVFSFNDCWLLFFFYGLSTLFE